MGKILKGTVAAAALAAATIGMTAPAQARPWHGGYHGYYHGGHWGHYYGGGGAAVAAGILGLGVSAAIASADRPYYRGYYAPPPPPPPSAYYGYYGAPPPPPPGYYGYGW